MEVLVKRVSKGDQGVSGIMTLPNGQRLATGEDPSKNNSQSLSDIPKGTYPLNLRLSSHFGIPMYHIDNVPNRTDCMIHYGNYYGDITKGWDSDVEGCIIVGMSHGQILNKNKVEQQAVISSKMAFTEFMDSMKENGVQLPSGSITITEDFTDNPEPKKETVIEVLEDVIKKLL